MATQYTPILQLALPVTGELNGTWGDVVNENITSMVEQAIAGLATINTWAANSHTLTTADGTTDEARCAMLVAADGAGGTALTGAGQIICPARTKLYVLKNSSSYAITLKTSAGTGVAVPVSDTAFLFCDGTNVGACVTTIVNGHIAGNLTVDGNTILGNATSDTITANARIASDLNPSADNTYDLGTVGNSWRNLYVDGIATIATLNVTTIDITNLEVTNIKAKDGTAAITLADSTGVATFSATPVLNAGTINQVQFLNASKQLVGDADFTFDGTTLSVAGLTLTNSPTLNGGTANQVQFLNASKVLSGDADLTFDGTTLTAANFTSGGTVTLSGGTANGVAYLNGSKVLTSGSAMTFDGTTFSAPNISATSLIVGGDLTWTQSTDSYSRNSGVSASTPVVTDVHKNMRRCLLRDDLTVNYYLDPTNSALKADGTSSVLTGADGQVMVEIPAFYVKYTPGANRNWAVSLLPAAGYTLHPVFMKDGAFVPYRYFGAYDACVFNGSVYESGLNYDNNWSAGQNWQADGAAAKLSSISGVYPAVGATRANFRTMAANRGTGWRQVDFYLASAVQLLYLVEYGSFNSQAKIGDGNTSVTNAYNAPSSGTQTDSPHSVAGKSNSLGNASTNTTNGAASTTRDTAYMSYRGIENFYGNCWNWVDGFNINNNQGYVSNTRANFADDTATNYDIIGAPMVASDGWVTNVQQLQFGFLPSAVGGGSTTYIADYYYQNTGWRVAILGGSAINGAAAGAFSWNLDNASGFLSRNIGGRLAA